MKKLFLSAAVLSFLGAGIAAAQDIYKVEQFSATDLNGDARYVGMGGAMSALGANISALHTNPAAAGLYRRSDFAITGSLLTQPGDSRSASYLGSSKTKASLDQLGFVYALNFGERTLKFVNFGFSYKKSRNFHNTIALNNIPIANGASQTWQMRDLAFAQNRWLDLSKDADRRLTTPFTNLGHDVFLVDPVRDAEGTITGYKNSTAEAYHYGRSQWGGTHEFDFNLSFNFSDQVYAGVNVGVYNIEGTSSLEYEEASLGEDGKPFMDAQGNRKTYLMRQFETIEGTGVDAKLGVIVRPIAESPFRMGVSASLPTFYTINTSSRLEMSSPYGHTNTDNGKYYEFTKSDMITNNEYRMSTPWKFNFSLATTVGNSLALAAEYEIADHTSAQVRYVEPDDYYYSDGWSTGTRDKALQSEIDNYLSDTHTLRLGLEARIAPEFFWRLGYNFVSAPMKKNAFLNLFTDSPSYEYAQNTDYVNLGVTNRFTTGLGYRGRNFYADVAYQYQHQEADVYAFSYRTDHSLTNALRPESVALNRHQVSLTMGYRF